MNAADKEEMLEMLKRLQRQVNMAIGYVESDRLHINDGHVIEPGVFKLGDFDIIDRTRRH